MEENYKKLNDFFVDCFYTILRQEEISMENYSGGNLSISEVHLIDAIAKSAENNAANSVSRHLKITPGSLTVAVNTLIAKGYAERKKDEKDKRVARLYLTEKGQRISELHAKFHENMVSGIIQTIDGSECKVLISALGKINQFMEKIK